MMHPPIRPFGRVARYAVLRALGAYQWSEPCSCPACWDAGVAGPPRLVPDGTDPRACPDCAGVGFQLTDGTPPTATRCRCLMQPPPAGWRPIEMGRWLHGAELKALETAEADYRRAVGGWVSRATGRHTPQPAAQNDPGATIARLDDPRWRPRG